MTSQVLNNMPCAWSFINLKLKFIPQQACKIVHTKTQKTPAYFPPSYRAAAASSACTVYALFATAANHQHNSLSPLAPTTHHQPNPPSSATHGSFLPQPKQPHHL